MESVQELKETLCERGYENSVVLESPSYLSAVIGISESGSVCYSYEKMIECLMHEDGMDYEEAMEFVDYNTVRALPYMSSYGVAPTVVYEDDSINPDDMVGYMKCPVCGGKLEHENDFYASDIYEEAYEGDEQAMHSVYHCKRCGRQFEITDPRKEEREGEYKEYWNEFFENNDKENKE